MRSFLLPERFRIRGEGQVTVEPGTSLGRYQVLGPLGHGGMASVYRAFQPALERVVALKVLRPAYAGDPEFLERFRRSRSRLGSRTRLHASRSRKGG